MALDPGTVSTGYFAPSLEDMRLWRDTLKSEWSQSYDGGTTLDDAMEKEEDLYFQKFDILSPGGQMAVRTGSAPADADAAVDTLAPSDIMVRVTPLRDKKVYREQAEKLTRFARGMLHEWRKRRDPFRLIASNMVIRRIGIARVLVDDSLWPVHPPSDLSEEDEERWETKNRRRCPIILEVRNPKFCRFRETSDGSVYAVAEEYYTTAVNALLTWPQFDDVQRILRGYLPTERVRIDDVWVGAHRAIFLEDMPIFPGEGVVEHGYVEVPYAIAPFRELPFENPGERYRGMLTNAAGLYPIESNVMTMQVWMLAWNAWRTWATWTKDNRVLEIIPGKQVRLDKRIGEYAEMLMGEPVPPELLQTASIVDSYIERNGVAQGPRSGQGTRSAQQVWAIQSIRQLKIDPAKQSLQRLVARCLTLAAMHVETVLKEPLTLPVPGRDQEGNDLGQIRITPGDIDGYWEGFEAQFSRRLDPALLEQAKELSALAHNKWMPQRVSYELSGLTDVPQEWIDQLLEEATDSLDFILETAAIERAKDFYGEDSWQFQMMMQKHAQQQESAQPMQGGPLNPGSSMQPTSPNRGPAPGGGPGQAGPSATGGSSGPSGAPRGMPAAPTAPVAPGI